MFYVIGYSLVDSTIHRKWRAAPICWKEWDDGILIYNPSSGNTHVLNPASAKILRVLEQNAASTDEVLQRITPEIAPGDAEVLTSIEKFVHDLEELGLIEPASE